MDEEFIDAENNTDGLELAFEYYKISVTDWGGSGDTQTFWDKDKAIKKAIKSDWWPAYNLSHIQLFKDKDGKLYGKTTWLGRIPCIRENPVEFKVVAKREDNNEITWLTEYEAYSNTTPERIIAKLEEDGNQDENVGLYNVKVSIGSDKESLIYEYVLLNELKKKRTR